LPLWRRNGTAARRGLLIAQESLALQDSGSSVDPLSPRREPPRADQVRKNGAPPHALQRTVDPRTISNFRNVAGLPVQNTGRFLSEGVLWNADGVLIRPALPLKGNVGGIPEFVIPNPAAQVRLKNVQGLNPEF
jgi:hypothetical protein